MYRPEHFAEENPEVLISAMRDIQFAALVTPSSDGIQMTHLPAAVRSTGEADGIVLETHVARANPHWNGHRAFGGC